MEDHLEAQIGVDGAAMSTREAAQKFFAVAAEKIDPVEQIMIWHQEFGSAPDAR